MNQTDSRKNLYTQWDVISFLGKRRRLNICVNKINADLLDVQELTQNFWQRFVNLFIFFPRNGERNFVFKKDDFNQMNVRKIFKDSLPIYDDLNKRVIEGNCESAIIAQIFESLGIIPKINSQTNESAIYPLFSGTKDEIWDNVMHWTLSQKKIVDLHS